MLKLRSSATATESGKSPAAKFEIAWTSPFSRSSKSRLREARDRLAAVGGHAGIHLDKVDPRGELPGGEARSPSGCQGGEEAHGRDGGPPAANGDTIGAILYAMSKELL